MASVEWLRTFVAAYRSESVSAAARQRGLSQPAASQHLAGLERRVGSPLFERTRTGVQPTARGRELYLEVAGALDRLETVFRGLDGGRLRSAAPALRVGSTAEFFPGEILPRLAGLELALTAVFRSDDELHALLARGEVDVVVARTPAPRRTVTSLPIGRRGFVLVGPPGSASDADSIELLAEQLGEQPWVSYSLELPITRRFWQLTLQRPFPARLRLVAPDLRAVLTAVELGLGVSLLPAYVCAEALAAGRVVEVFDVADLVPSEPWFCCARSADLDRSEVAAVLAALAEPAPSSPSVAVGDGAASSPGVASEGA